MLESFLAHNKFGKSLVHEAEKYRTRYFVLLAQANRRDCGPRVCPTAGAGDLGGSRPSDRVPIASGEASDEEAWGKWTSERDWGNPGR